MPNKKQQLYKLLAKIPKGKITTYKILAQKLKIHPRTAGIFLSQNDYPRKYPCYKVVKSDGSIGGYSAIGGTKKKIILLQEDGIKIKDNRVTNIKEITYDF